MNTEYVEIENLQAVGEWREYGLLNITPGLVTEGRSEQNRILRSKFQGRIGMRFRSADRWQVTAKTSNSVTTYWSVWPLTGQFRGSDNVVYMYTGTSRSGTSFTFTGVTPDPNAAGITQVRNPRGGTGFANTIIIDTLTSGFDHVNGSTVNVYGLTDSKALEASGYPLR